MTTSYLRNINFSNLFVYYALDSQVSLSSSKFTWRLNKIIIHPKIMKILRTASLDSNFTGSYKKECSMKARNLEFRLNKSENSNLATCKSSKILFCRSISYYILCRKLDKEDLFYILSPSGI